MQQAQAERQTDTVINKKEIYSGTLGFLYIYIYMQALPDSCTDSRFSKQPECKAGRVTGFIVTMQSGAVEFMRTSRSQVTSSIWLHLSGLTNKWHTLPMI